MWLYIIFLLILVGLAIQYDLNSGRSKGREGWINFVICGLILIAGLRYRMGTDSISYEAWFKDCPTLFNFSYSFYIENLNDRIAPLCAILFSIVKTFTDDFVFLQLTICLFVNVSILYTLNKLGANKFFFTVVILYFIHLYFSINCESLRESIAIGWFYLAIPNLIEKNYRSYYVLMLCAIGFHYGATILLIVPFLSSIKLGSKTIFAIAAAVVLTPFLTPLLESFNAIVFLTGSMSGMVDSYLGKSADRVTFMSVKGVIADVGIPLFCLYYVKKHKPEYAIFEYLLILEIILRILGQSLYILYRYDNYLRFIYIYYYAAFIFAFFDNNVRRKTVFEYLVLIGIQFYACFSYWNNPLSYDLFGETPKRYLLIDPYTSVFDKKTDPEREYVYKSFHKE